MRNQKDPKGSLTDRIYSELRFLGNAASSILFHMFENTEINRSTGKIVRRYVPITDEKTYPLLHKLKAGYIVAKEIILHGMGPFRIDMGTLDVTKEEGYGYFGNKKKPTHL